jgi:hypothetical protein
VEVKPLETSPAATPPQVAPVPVPNWFNSAPAAAPPPAASPASRPGRPQFDENPFAIASPPPRKKNNNNGGGTGGGGDTFLSAKELAAAFKLSFDPSANMDAVDVPDDMPAAALPEGLIPGMGKPQMRQPQHSAPPLGGPAVGVAAPAPRRRGSRLAAVRRVALFMLILAGTGLGVMLWVDPVFRQKTVDWSKGSFAKLHAYATAQDMKGQPAPPPAPPPPKPDKSVKDSESDITKAAAAPREPIAKPKDEAPLEQPKAAAPVEPKAATPEVIEPPAPPPAARPDAPAPSVVNKTAAPAPAAPKTVPPPAPPASDASAKPPAEQEEPIPATRAGQVERKQQLYKQGRQAEFGNPPDYAAAFKAYSAIKKLPSDVWPSDLEYRLGIVQKKLK